MISAAMEPDEVTELSIVDAIKLMREYFWPHARAALRQIGLTDRHKHLRRALRWIQAHRLPVVSLKDIRREALGGSLSGPSWRASVLDPAVRSRACPTTAFRNRQQPILIRLEGLPRARSRQRPSFEMRA